MLLTETHRDRWRLMAALVVVFVMAAAFLAPAAAHANPPTLGTIELLDDDDSWADPSGGTNLDLVKKAISADYYYDEGYDGSGVDVAIIDSGVVPVPALPASKVINGPDLSFESQAENLMYLDTFGHGTHLAGIIAGDGDGFEGVAPGARLVNIKVADANGAADVTQVIAAIDWVVEHRTDNGMNIRVLNLAFGTDGVQPHQVDPLHFAVERAWQAGIVVVVAAGNDGNDALLRNPASDPYVIAVGATDTHGSDEPENHTVTPFSNCGSEDRRVDLVAPGKSIISLSAPGSVAHTDHPAAQVGEDKFKGSGTSQASAVVSGAVALVLDQRPNATPDEVKQLLISETKDLDSGTVCQGHGALWLEKLADGDGSTSGATQTHPLSNGTGSIDAARGSHRVVDEGVAISGEVDIFGNPYDSAARAEAAAAGLSWSGGTWNGASWSGASWSGLSWSGASWSGASWSGASWSGASWSSKSWSGASWSGASWSGASWSGASWSGASWSGNVWLGLSWR